MRWLQLFIVTALVVALFSGVAHAQPENAPVAVEDAPVSVSAPASVSAPVVEEPQSADIPFDPFAEPTRAATPEELQTKVDEANWGYAVAVILVLLFLGLCSVDGYRNGWFIAPDYRGFCQRVEDV